MSILNKFNKLHCKHLCDKDKNFHDDCHKKIQYETTRLCNLLIVCALCHGQVFKESKEFSSSVTARAPAANE